jgi:hypothetical protein
LLISKVLNAATVTSVTALESASVSLLMTIFGIMGVVFPCLACQRTHQQWRARMTVVSITLANHLFQPPDKVVKGR